MLVDCPKCGFSQPQDQYCAKCGVDMVAFRARPAPVRNRLLANPVFHISVIFIFVFVGALYIIREQRRQEIIRRADYLKNGPIYAKTKAAEPPMEAAASAPPPPGTTAKSSDSAPSTATDLASASTAAAAEPPSPNSLRATASAISGIQPTTARAIADSKDSDSNVKAKSIKLNSQYTLVPSAILSSILADTHHATSFASFGEFQLGSVDHLSNSRSKFKIYEKKELSLAVEGGEINWFAGDTNPDGSRIGITTKIALKGYEGDHLQGDIEVRSSLFEGVERGQGPLVKVYGPAEFSIAPHATLMVILSVPRVPQFDARLGTPDNFLSLFALRDFVQKHSEFVMLFDFE